MMNLWKDREGKRTTKDREGKRTRKKKRMIYANLQQWLYHWLLVYYTAKQLIFDEVVFARPQVYMPIYNNDIPCQTFIPPSTTKNTSNKQQNTLNIPQTMFTYMYSSYNRYFFVVTVCMYTCIWNMKSYTIKPCFKADKVLDSVACLFCPCLQHTMLEKQHSG